MAVAVQVSGLVTVKVDNATLGYGRNGVTIVTEGHYLDVKGDELGGDEGPPIEIQQLGETGRVRLELTKWEEAIALQVMSRVKGGTAGTPPAPGTLLFTGMKYFVLSLASPNKTWSFPRAVPRHAIEINRGTKFSTFVCEFECYQPGPGVAWLAIG